MRSTYYKEPQRIGIGSVFSEENPAPNPIETVTAPIARETEGGYLDLFNLRLRRGSRSSEWVFSRLENTEPPHWEAIAFVNGEQYGRGLGITKKIAKENAAKVSLDRMGDANK